MNRRQTALLDKLVSSQRPALLRFLSRKLGSVDDAQEVAQDAFLRLHRIENPDELDDARAFLFQVASNIAIDQLRRRRLQARYLEEEGERLREAFEHPDPRTPEALLAARQQLARVFRAIETMPQRWRRALMLARVHGCSHGEIARELGVSVSSVEKYILEASKRCRDHRLQ